MPKRKLNLGQTRSRLQHRLRETHRRLRKPKKKWVERLAAIAASENVQFLGRLEKEHDRLVDQVSLVSNRRLRPAQVRNVLEVLVNLLASDSVYFSHTSRPLMSMPEKQHYWNQLLELSKHIGLTDEAIHDHLLQATRRLSGI